MFHQTNVLFYRKCYGHWNAAMWRPEGIFTLYISNIVKRKGMHNAFFAEKGGLTKCGKCIKPALLS